MTSLKFGEFYGYKLNGFKHYRFGHTGFGQFFGYYRIVDCSGICVYIRRVPRARFLYDETPYFSTTPSSEKYPLDIKHLRKQGVLPKALVKEARWYYLHLPSLAMVINGRSLVNQLLFPAQPGVDSLSARTH